MKAHFIIWELLFIPVHFRECDGKLKQREKKNETAVFMNKVNGCS